MVKSILRSCVLSAMLVFCANANAGNEMTDKHGDFFRLLLPTKDDVRLQYIYEPEHEEDGGPGKFDLNYFSAQGELPLALSEDSFFRIGGAYSARVYDFEEVRGANTDTDSDTMHLTEVLAGYGIFLSDNILLTGKATLGAYGDFDGGLDSDDFAVHGEALAVFRLNPGAQLLAGARYSEDFDDAPLIPLLGIRLLSEDGALHITLTAPVELRVGYNISSDLELYCQAALHGEKYRISAGRRDDFNAQVQDRRFGLGIDYWMLSHMKLGLEAGVALGSELEFKTRDPGQFDGDLDPAGYVSASLGFAL